MKSEDWLTGQITKLDRMELQQFAITAWTIWNRRNAEVHGAECHSSSVAADFIGRYISEYREAQAKQSERQTTVAAADMGFHSIVLEGDFLTIIK